MIDLMLSELGENIGIESLAFNQDGYCNLTVNGDNHITIFNNEVNDEMVLVGDLDQTLTEETPFPLIENLFRSSFEQAFDGCASVAVETETKKITLIKKVSILNKSPITLKIDIFNFVDQMIDIKSSNSVICTTISEKKDPNQPIFMKMA